MEIIAFYLPQYHPTPNNNKWWGEGFTEWTNVARAKRLYPGHYQPKVPADLGFYDLRMPEIKEKQAELAKEAGVTGFCYYHYWFGNGHEELDLPFKQVVSTGMPDFPFCLCWANESWSKKMWDNDGSVKKRVVLAEQTYPGEKDDIMHFNSLYNAFIDKRYIKIDGRPLFMIYKPLTIPDFISFKDIWNKLAEEKELPPFFFVGFTFNPDKEYKEILESGYDAVVSCRLSYGNQTWFQIAFRKVLSIIMKIPIVLSYKKVYKTFMGDLEKTNNKVYPTLIPNWDHTPRSGYNGFLYSKSTPELFQKHAEDVLSYVNNKEKKICFLKSWNEWGEGNYMEPDLRYGKGFIKALRNALNTL